MNKLYPHIGFFFVLFLVFTIGALTESRWIAGLSTAMMAFITDPFLLIGSILIGGLILNPKFLIPAAIGFAVMLSIVTLQKVEAAELALLIVVARIFTVLLIALATNAIRLMIVGSPGNS